MFIGTNRVSPGVSPNYSQTRFLHHFLDASLDPLFSQSDAPRLPKATPKPSKMEPKSVPRRVPKRISNFDNIFHIFINFLTWLCAANIVNNVSKPHFSFAHAVKENPKRALQKHLKFTPKTTPKSVPNPIQTETQKKRSKKCFKLRNDAKNV